METTSSQKTSVRMRASELIGKLPEPWTPHQSGKPYLLYLFYWAFFPLLLYLLPIPLVRTPAFEHWSPSEWGPILDYAFDVKEDSDVVIFGDSSAFVGIDPRVVDHELGLRSVVLPGTIGSLPVVGDQALNTYLSHHRTPRLLVLYFSPWHLDYNHAESAQLFEGEEMFFRHSGWGEILRFTRLHPFETLRFPFRVYTTFHLGLLRRNFRHVDAQQSIADARGHYDYWDDPFPPLSDKCSFPAKLLSAQSQVTIEHLVRTYEGRMPVMVYLAPIPGCNNVGQVLQRSYPGLRTASPAVLPPHEFIGDPHYAHMEPPFVRDSTQAFIAVLSHRLGLFQVKSVPRRCTVACAQRVGDDR